MGANVPRRASLREPPGSTLCDPPSRSASRPRHGIVDCGVPRPAAVPPAAAPGRAAAWLRAGTGSRWRALAKAQRSDRGWHADCWPSGNPQQGVAMRTWLSLSFLLLAPGWAHADEPPRALAAAAARDAQVPRAELVTDPPRQFDDAALTRA